MIITFTFILCESKVTFHVTILYFVNVMKLLHDGRILQTSKFIIKASHML